jgi:NitT/TauT family transport system substrate-binding protein
VFQQVLRAACVVAALVGFTVGARAEANVVRLTKQFGLIYLPIDVMVERKLIEKRAQENGLPDVRVELVKLSGGSSLNEVLLAGQVDFVSAGVPPLLTIWDKTRGGLDVRAVGGISAVPMVLTSNNPAVKTVADFTEQDRIALPAPRVSIQAIVLQMAAEKILGDANKLDRITVAMTHPDVIGTLKNGPGRSAVSGHFSIPPFTEQALAVPGVHKVLDSHEFLGGPYTQIVLYNARRWKDDNPRLYRAVAQALDDAMTVINADKRAAAETYIAANGTKDSVEAITRIISDPQFQFTSVPLRTMLFADFLNRQGVLKNKPASWRDLFWENQHERDGS